MFKFAVICLFVLGCSAQSLFSPSNKQYSNSFSTFSGSRFSKPTLSNIAVSQPAQYSWAQPAQVAYTVAQPSVSWVAQPLSTGFLGSNLNVNYANQDNSARVLNSGLFVDKNIALFSDNAEHVSHPFESVVPAAIQHAPRTVEYKTVPHGEHSHQTQVLEVEPSDNPIHIHFKTRSSTLSLSQSHTPAAAQEVQSASAQDEPARLITEVQKPVIQEVRETILPYRAVHQTISPLVESVHSVVSKGEAQPTQFNGANYAAVQTTPTFAVQPVVANVQTASYSAPVSQVARFAQVTPVSKVSEIAVAPSVANFAHVPSLNFASQVSPVVQTFVQPTEFVSQTKPTTFQTSYNTASTSGGY